MLMIDDDEEAQYRIGQVFASVAPEAHKPGNLI